MPGASKKSRIHKKPRLGPSSANTETTADGKKITDASTDLGRHLEQTGPFMNIPVDIFLEIAAYCRPYDLLNLSRVSTKLRAVVLAKRNRSLWVCATNNLDLPIPPCPDDLSEPKYASLVFDTFCTACGGRPGPSDATLRDDYAARIRLCEQCWKTNVKTGHTILRELEPQFRRDRSLKRVLFDLVPGTNSPYKYLSKGSDTFHQELYLNFYQPEVVAAAKEYHAVEQSSGGDIRVLEEYVDRRKARTLERLKFHSAVEHWVYDHAHEQEMVKIQSAIDRLIRVTMMIRALEGTVAV